jgi:hypothetical protein
MIARVLGNAELILDKRLKNKPTLTSYGYRLVGKSSVSKLYKDNRYLSIILD